MYRQRMRSRRLLASLAASVLLGGLVTSCQSQSSLNRNPHVGSTTASAGPDGVQVVDVTTGDDYRFHPSTITVHPGKVRIVLHHTGTGAPHDWALKGFADAFSVPLINGGETKSVEFSAPSPGSYTFVCTIHVAQGQTGTFVVLPQ